MCGCGQDGPHFIRLSDFVNKLKLDLRKRVAKKGSIDTVAAILSAANVDAIATTATIGGNWCKRNNVRNNKGKVASMLPPGVVFGWVDRVDGEAAVGGALDTRVLEAASEGDGADDATPLGQEVTANALLTLASAQPSLLVLILNLDRRSDRLEALRAQSGMQRLRCERVQAVDGASSSWEGLAPVLTPTALEDARWAELHRVPTLCRATESFSPHHTRASAACAATHKKAWERLEASSCDVALILEDDARVAPDLADAVQQVLGALEQHPFWKVCHLGTHEGGIKLKGANKRAALADELEQGEVRTGLAGYLVRRSDVRELLDGVFPLDEQLDVALSQHPFGHGARHELSSLPRPSAFPDGKPRSNGREATLVAARPGSCGQKTGRSGSCGARHEPPRATTQRPARNGAPSQRGRAGGTPTTVTSPSRSSSTTDRRMASWRLRWRWRGSVTRCAARAASSTSRRWRRHWMRCHASSRGGGGATPRWRAPNASTSR
jgi:GR25 family glycosyltransferase involved in LPS biosynthesis